MFHDEAPDAGDRPDGFAVEWSKAFPPRLVWLVPSRPMKPDANRRENGSEGRDQVLEVHEQQRQASGCWIYKTALLLG